MLKNTYALVIPQLQLICFIPRADVFDIEDDEMDVTDHELEEFERFCFINKPLENHSKVTVRVNLSELTLKKT